jgi:hypothetical protein
MRPLDRIEFETKYLHQRARTSGFRIILQVSSSGASFSIRDPEDGTELHRSAITESQTTAEFCGAVDSAILTAKRASELGILP